MKYDFNDGTNEAQLAFYPTDGGTYRGKSKDSSRFSINPVNADDSVPQGTNTKEKNSIVVRGAHTFKNILGQEISLLNLAPPHGIPPLKISVQGKMAIAKFIRF